jgi:hypothetical protein
MASFSLGERVVGGDKGPELGEEPTHRRRSGAAVHPDLLVATGRRVIQTPLSIFHHSDYP